MALAATSSTPAGTEHLHVIVAPGDPGGYPVTHPYVEDLYVPVVGPSAYLLLRLLDRFAEQHPNSFTVSLDEIGQRLGLGGKGGSSRTTRAIARLCRFRLAARIDADTILIPRRLPPLTNPQLDRLAPRVARLDRLYRSTPTTSADFGNAREGEMPAIAT